MLTKAGAVVVGMHGSDTLATGLRTVWTGEVQETLTAQGTARAAMAAGASPETAQQVGANVDMTIGIAGAGLAGAVKMGVTRTAVSAAPSTAGGAARVAPRVLNAANHVFGPKSLAKRKLEGVLNAFKGDKVAAFNALERGAQQLANQGTIKGVFQTTVEVAGQKVTVRGAVLEGTAKVSTAFIP